MLRSLGCSEWSLHPEGLLWASSGQERLVAWPLCFLRGTGEVILNAAAVGSERDLSVTGVGETPRSEPEDAGWACSRAATRLRACPEVCTLAGSPHLRLFHLGTKAAGLRHCGLRPPRCLPQAGLVQKSIFFVLHMCFAPAVGLALKLSRDGPYPQKWKLLVIV